MKKGVLNWVLVLSVCGLMAVLFVSLRGRRAAAGEPTPPSRMDLLEAAQLDAALQHIENLERQAAPFIRQTEALCAKYKIPPQQAARSVNFATGEIMRQPLPMPPKPEEK